MLVIPSDSLGQPFSRDTALLSNRFIVQSDKISMIFHNFYFRFIEHFTRDYCKVPDFVTGFLLPLCSELDERYILTEMHVHSEISQNITA